MKRNVYSINSAYVGLQLEVRIQQDELELWYQNKCVERLPRLFGCGQEAIDFRHVIDSLVRKPGAFANYKYVHHLYPTTHFRMAYDQLLTNGSESAAVKQYLKILHAAKHEGLDLVDEILRGLLSEGQTITAARVLEAIATQKPPRPAVAVQVNLPDLSEYDCLLQHKDVSDEKVPCHDDPPAIEPTRGELAAYDRHLEVVGSTQGAAAPDVSRTPPTDSGASGPRTLDAHAVPGGTRGAGMSDETPEPHPTPDACPRT